MGGENVVFDSPGLPHLESQINRFYIVFYRILKITSMILAALIAPLAYLTKKPTVPAMLATAIVVLEMLQLVLHLDYDGWEIVPQRRKPVRRVTRDRTRPTWEEGDAHFPRN